jgi:hypothetical protein
MFRVTLSTVLEQVYYAMTITVHFHSAPLAAFIVAVLFVALMIYAILIGMTESTEQFTAVSENCIETQ